MKKFSKILSSVLAASMLISCFAMNALAASTQHTMTLSADKTENLKVGDVVTVTIAIDGTQNICAAGYDLAYDTEAFKIDTDMGEYYEKYIDGDWYYDNLENTRASAWAKALGFPTYNAADGKISFKWAASKGVDKNVADFEIGKFFFEVQAIPADGVADFALTYASTTDLGQNAGTAASTAPLTVAFEAAEEEVTYDDVATGAFTFTTGPKYNGNEGFKLFFNKTENEETSQVYAELAKTEIFEAGTTVQADMEVSVGVEVKDVPSNVVLEFLRAEWLETLTK